MSDEAIIDQICDLATTGQWTIFDIIEFYAKKKRHLDAWSVLQEMLRSGHIRINAQGTITS